MRREQLQIAATDREHFFASNTALCRDGSRPVDTGYEPSTRSGKGDARCRLLVLTNIGSAELPGAAMIYTDRIASLQVRGLPIEVVAIMIAGSACRTST